MSQTSRKEREIGNFEVIVKERAPGQKLAIRLVLLGTPASLATEAGLGSGFRSGTAATSGGATSEVAGTGSTESTV